MIPEMEMWMLLILGSAVALGLYDVSKKHVVAGNPVMPVLFVTTLCGSGFYLLMSWLSGAIPAYLGLSTRFHLLVIGKTFLVAGSWVAIYCALRELPISIVSPIRASSPFWVCIGGVLLYHEIPAPLQAAGMVLILIGYYLFSVAGNLEGISFRRHRGIHLVFIGTLLGACSGLYDKYLLGRMQLSKDAMQFWFSLDMVILLGLAWLVVRLVRGKGPAVRWRWSIPVTGILLIVADWLYFYSLSFPDSRISLISLLRRCSVIVSFTAGSIFFHDVNLKRKAVALGVILLGVMLLIFAR